MCDECGDKHRVWLGTDMWGEDEYGDCPACVERWNAEDEDEMWAFMPDAPEVSESCDPAQAEFDAEWARAKPVKRSEAA